MICKVWSSKDSVGPVSERGPLNQFTTGRIKPLHTICKFLLHHSFTMYLHDVCDPVITTDHHGTKLTVVDNLTYIFHEFLHIGKN